MLEQATVPSTTEAIGLFEPLRRTCFLDTRQRCSMVKKDTRFLKDTHTPHLENLMLER